VFRDVDDELAVEPSAMDHAVDVARLAQINERHVAGRPLVAELAAHDVARCRRRRVAQLLLDRLLQIRALRPRRVEDVNAAGGVGAAHPQLVDQLGRVDGQLLEHLRAEQILASLAHVDELAVRQTGPRRTAEATMAPAALGTRASALVAAVQSRWGPLCHDSRLARRQLRQWLTAALGTRFVSRGAVLQHVHAVGADQDYACRAEQVLRLNRRRHGDGQRQRRAPAVDAHHRRRRQRQHRVLLEPRQQGHERLALVESAESGGVEQGAERRATRESAQRLDREQQRTVLELAELPVDNVLSREPTERLQQLDLGGVTRELELGALAQHGAGAQHDARVTLGKSLIRRALRVGRRDDEVPVGGKRQRRLLADQKTLQVGKRLVLAKLAEQSIDEHCAARCRHDGTRQRAQQHADGAEHGRARDGTMVRREMRARAVVPEAAGGVELGRLDDVEQLGPERLVLLLAAGFLQRERRALYVHIAGSLGSRTSTSGAGRLGRRLVELVESLAEQRYLVVAADLAIQQLADEHLDGLVKVVQPSMATGRCAATRCSDAITLSSRLPSRRSSIGACGVDGSADCGSAAAACSTRRACQPNLKTSVRSGLRSVTFTSP
jgi:hypothetical protein